MNWIRDYWKMLLLVIPSWIVIAWLWHDRQPIESGQTVVATPAPEVKNLPMVGIHIKAPVKVYTGGARLKQRIDLPQDVVQDERKQVIASSKIDASDDHPHTVTTVIDTETGESQTFVRTDPLPWLAWDDRGGVGLYAGIKNGATTVRLQARQGLFSIKAVHVGMLASIDQPLPGPALPGYFVGIGAEYRW